MKTSSIIDVVKDLAACDCYCDEDDGSLCDPCQRILEVFRPAADALLIAVDSLETLTNATSAGDVKEAKEALSRIKSLPIE